MPTSREPVQLSNIDEGLFLPKVDAQLRKLQEAIIQHGSDYGSLAKGDKATLTIKVSLKLEAPEHGIYKIVARHESSLPSCPATESLGVQECDQETGELFIGVARSGSRPDHPDQGTLCTSTGEGIDHDTGKPSKEKTIKLGAAS